MTGCQRCRKRPSVRASRLAPAALWLVAAGCGTVPRTQFDAVSAQNRVLLEQRRTNLNEIEALRTHARDVEDRLILAQREVARLELVNAESPASARLSDRRRAQNE